MPPVAATGLASSPDRLNPVADDFGGTYVEEYTADRRECLFFLAEPKLFFATRGLRRGIS